MIIYQMVFNWWVFTLNEVLKGGCLKRGIKGWVGI